MAEQENLARLQDEMTRRVNRLLLSREARVLEIERSRASRAAKESVNEALESAGKSKSDEGLNACCSILVVSCVRWGATLDSSDVLLPCSIIPLALHMTIILISTLF